MAILSSGCYIVLMATLQAVGFSEAHARWLHKDDKCPGPQLFFQSRWLEEVQHKTVVFLRLVSGICVPS